MSEKKTKLAEIKTKQTTASVTDFINNLTDEQKRRDSFAILKLMEEASGQSPRMWGGSIIGFGNKIYRSPKTGREVDWLVLGFSPRKANFSLYLPLSLKAHEDTLEAMGKHKTGVGCLYINKLEDINVDILKELIVKSVVVQDGFC